jgi:hypothetical protein
MLESALSDSHTGPGEWELPDAYDCPALPVTEDGRSNKNTHVFAQQQPSSPRGRWPPGQRYIGLCMRRAAPLFSDKVMNTQGQASHPT